jgi:chemotaxis methyl-accepting protein methylase
VNTCAVATAGKRGWVVDYQAHEPFDFVLCQGVLAYLSPTDLKSALRNLGMLSQGALFVEQ